MSIVGGFEVAVVDLPVPVDMGDLHRERMMDVLAAIILNATPEAVAGYLAAGFPVDVAGLRARPCVDDELSAFVDLLLVAAQS